MPDSKKKIALVVPCYNEADRIDINEFLKHSSELLRIVFVNDGSTDGTLELLKQQEGDSVSVLSLARNMGKAEAIRQGVLYVITQKWYEGLDYVGYWDADLATPLEEVENFIKYQSTFYKNADAIFGSRVKRIDSSISRKISRHYLGRIFSTVVSMLFGINAYDTQCGAKLFSRSVVRQVFKESFNSRWCFDIEILLRMKDFVVIEYPLFNWADKSGSKINIFTAVFPVMRELYVIYMKYK